MGTFPFLLPSLSIFWVIVQRHPDPGLWFREGNSKAKALVMAVTSCAAICKAHGLALVFITHLLSLCLYGEFPAWRASQDCPDELQEQLFTPAQGKEASPVQNSFCSWVLKQKHFKGTPFPETTKHFLIIWMFLRCPTDLRNPYLPPIILTWPLRVQTASKLPCTPVTLPLGRAKSVEMGRDGNVHVPFWLKNKSKHRSKHRHCL